MIKNYSIQDELAKALYKFSYGRLTVTQAEMRAEEVMKNIDATNEGLSHKGINWYAKQIIGRMQSVNTSELNITT